MSAKVSVFAPARIGTFSYLFFIVGWNDYATQLKEELVKQLDAFGADLATSGMVLQSYKASEYSTFDEIRGKKWPPEFLKRLQEDVNPCMLIIQRDFEAFSPDTDRWAVVWFSDLANYAKDLPQLFHKLAQLSRSGSDVFDYLKRLALEHHGKKIAGLGRVAKYFEVKPEIFGISLDVGSIIADLSGAVSGREKARP